jgi:SAM-dependent methyltransferase
MRVTNGFLDGSGPGPWTADGSPLDLYRLLKPNGEPELIRAVLPDGVSILELGCGCGRITHPLIQYGFQVTAVDGSEEMLELVEGAERILADIATLDLGRTFDAVLLMSHLVDTPDEPTRHALLACCRRHLATGGSAIVQKHDPRWLDHAEVGFLGNGAGVECFLDSVERDGADVKMAIRWQSDERTWTQRFVVRRLDENEIAQIVADAGLRIDQWLDEQGTWFSAKAV